MRRMAYALANLFGGVVLALLVLDPTRDLGVVYVLLAAAVLLMILARNLPKRFP